MANGTGPSSPFQGFPEPRGLLRTLVAAFSGVLIGLLLSKMTPPRKIGNSKPPQGDTGKESEGSAEEQPVVPKAMPAPSPSNEPNCRVHVHTPWWKTLAELIGVGAVVWYAFLTHSMWKEIQKQTTIQRMTLDSTQRPWIVSEFVPLSLIFREDGVFLQSQYHLLNTGHSLAESITVWTDLTFDPRDLEGQRDKYCASPKFTANYDSGNVLFAGQGNTSNQTALGEANKLKAALNDPLNETKQALIALITCVDYRYSLDPGMHHQTTVIYRLERPDPKTGFVTGAFNPSGVYTPNQFRMEPYKISAN